MRRSFYYIIVLGLCSCGGPLSGQKLPIPIFILAADAPSKPPELRSAGTEKAAPGEKACIKGACYIYAEINGSCFCRMVNPAKASFSSSQTSGFTSSSCDWRFSIKPPELKDQLPEEARLALSAEQCCNPSQDFMQWQDEEMKCYEKRQTRFWLHEPACDATCPSSLTKGGER